MRKRCAGIFGATAPDGNGLIVQPNRWRLVWHAGSPTITTLPEVIDAPKAGVAALAAALGVRIVEATPESWGDLVR